MSTDKVVKVSRTSTELSTFTAIYKARIVDRLRYRPTQRTTLKIHQNLVCIDSIPSLQGIEASARRIA